MSPISFRRTLHQLGHLVRQRQQIALLLRQKLWHPGRMRYPAGHYYSPVPSQKDIDAGVRQVQDEELTGIQLDPSGQLSLLATLAPLAAAAPFSDLPARPYRYHFDNPSYSWGDALILFGLLRHLRPKRFIEVGSGFSSCVVLDTNEHFLERSIACTFIEPYPRLLLSLVGEQRIALVEQKVQEVDLALFDTLEAGDVLFIDSSHVSKAYSDINHILFRVLPRLRPGVWVHFHDIFYPFEYPEAWLRRGVSWNEAYLLRAYLMDNAAYRVRFFNDYVGKKHHAAVANAMPGFLKNPGGGLWLERQ